MECLHCTIWDPENFLFSKMINLIFFFMGGCIFYYIFCWGWGRLFFFLFDGSLENEFYQFDGSWGNIYYFFMGGW